MSSTKINTSGNTVCVKGLRENETREMIKTFFNENVGCVHDVEIHKNVNHHQHYKMVAYVEFTNEDHATRAIIRNKYVFNYHYIFITKSIDDYHPEEKTTTIIQLNDDCLLNIYKYLDTIDVVNLSLSFPRLNDFAQTYIYKYYAILDNENTDFYLNSPAKTEQPIVTFIGPFIKKLSLSNHHMDSSIRTLNLIFEHCKSLEHLRIKYFDSVFENLYLPQTVKSLEVICCSKLPSSFIESWTNLEKLILLQIDLIHIRDINSLNFLTELCLDAVEINNIIFTKIIKSNKKIRKLIVHDCRKLNGNIYSDLDKCLPELEHLCIDLIPDMESNQLNCLANIKNLRHLQISCGIFDISSCLNKLGEHLVEFEIRKGDMKTEILNILFKLKKLKMLKISYPKYVQNDIFMMISQHLPQLEELHFHGLDQNKIRDLIKDIKIKPEIKSLIITGPDGGFSYNYSSVLLVSEMLKMLHELNINTDSINQNQLKLIMNLPDEIFTRLKNLFLHGGWARYSNLLILLNYQPNLDTNFIFRSDGEKLFTEDTVLLKGLNKRSFVYGTKEN